MKILYVGRMVRIIGCVSPLMKHHIGKEGVITGRSVKRIGSWYVLGAETDSNGRSCSWRPDHIEPILDQHQSCEKDFKRDLDRMLERVTERVR